MKGILKKINTQWLVYYQEEIIPGVKKNQELPLFPPDANSLNESGEDSSFFDESKIDFEIIDEFTHQKLYEKMHWGVGKFAKLLK